jgi:hypothetical protein
MLHLLPHQIRTLKKPRIWLLGKFFIALVVMEIHDIIAFGLQLLDGCNSCYKMHTSAISYGKSSIFVSISIQHHVGGSPDVHLGFGILSDIGLPWPNVTAIVAFSIAQADYGIPNQFLISKSKCILSIFVRYELDNILKPNFYACSQQGGHLDEKLTLPQVSILVEAVTAAG